MARGGGGGRDLGDKFAEQLFALLYQEPLMPEEAIVRRLMSGRSGSKTLYRLFARLRQEGWLQRNPDGLLFVETRAGVLRINPRGFGFVISPDWPGQDVFVPERWLGGARHEDQVSVWLRLGQGTRGPEGRIMNVLKRATDVVVGKLERGRSGWRVVPQDSRRPVVEIGRLPKLPVQPGDMVSAKVVDWPLDPRRPVRGRIETVLGPMSAPGTDVAVLAAERRLPAHFPPQVVAAAAALPADVRPEDLVGRRDLQDEFVVTIDGKDAKDLDDAISIRETPAGYEIGVHIADVSYYVAEDSPLDIEARARGTSVYLVDRVIPMLPERLSNGIASLNPGVPRLTVSAFVEIDRKGNPIKTHFARSVIRTRHRLTYEEVNALLAGTADDPHGLLPWLKTGAALRDILRARRMARGAVDFDLPETKVILDADGHPVDVELRVRDVAETMIEEFMLLANEAVAHELLRHRLPGLFRIHEQPVSDKMDQFREMIGAQGYRLPNDITPKALQDLIGRVKGRPEERVINSALLRSMKQARYAADNAGHFGLASEEYTHFTSPIRRYPDLWVHRVLTAFLEGRITDEMLARWRRLAAEVGELASVKEREAMEAERDSVAMKEAEYMADKVGQTYEAVISGVASFGMFVELPNLIEGLVRLEDLPQDYWIYDPVHYRLTGRRTGREYRLGQLVNVQLVRVDVPLRRLDFCLSGPSLPAARPKAADAPKPRRRRRARS